MTPLEERRMNLRENIRKPKIEQCAEWKRKNA